jgi:hypothetical protein
MMRNKRVTVKETAGCAKAGEFCQLPCMASGVCGVYKVVPLYARRRKRDKKPGFFAPVSYVDG